MPTKKKVAECPRCHRTRELGPSGLCHECAIQKVRDAAEQLRAKSGPIYEKWREGLRRFARGER